jgi:hypothetical protein
MMRSPVVRVSKEWRRTGSTAEVCHFQTQSQLGLGGCVCADHSDFRMLPRGPEHGSDVVQRA